MRTPPQPNLSASHAAERALAFRVDLVERLDAPLREEIRALLAAPPHGAIPFAEHDPRWLDILCAGLGHRPYVLVARSTEQPAGIVGYLPLGFVTSRLFGRFLVSLPYLDRVGVVATDANVAVALVDAAVRLAAEIDADYLELRQEGLIRHSALTEQRSDKVRLVLPLPATVDDLWQRVGSKVRNQVRKGERNALAIQFGGTELLREFYAVFAANMRDLGTPVFSRRLFTEVLRSLAKEAEIAVVRHDTTPVAVALLIHSGDGTELSRTHVPSAASLRNARGINANMWMYYQLLTRAVERGSRRFDFGRSTSGSSTYRFKRQWGAQEQATFWQYHVRRGSMDAARPHHPRYALAIALWRRLPLRLTRLLGPLIARGLP